LPTTDGTSPEVASILEPILVADPDRLPTVGDALSRMRDVAARWGVAIPQGAELAQG
jgi:hypothetical protein